VGWILYFTSKSSNAQIINEQKAEVAEYKNTVLELQKNQEIQQLLTKKKQKSLSQLAEETEKKTLTKNTTNFLSRLIINYHLNLLQKSL